MRLILNGKMIGLVLGLLAGLLFVFLGWKAFLVLLGFILLGVSVGSLMDSRADMKRRLKKLTDRVLRT